MALNFDSPTRTPLRNLFGTPNGNPVLRMGPKRARLENVASWDSPGTPKMQRRIGVGSFGEVYEASTPQGSVAVKKVDVRTKHTKNLNGDGGMQPLTPEAVKREIKFLNSSGAVPGVPLQLFDEDNVTKNEVSMVTPLCVPIEPTDLEKILEVIGTAVLNLVYDLKPENIMKIPVGALVPSWVNGGIVYHPSAVEQVVITDLTYIPDQESGDSRWCPVNEVEDIRAFKRRMFEEWARNPDEDANVRRERVEKEFH